MLDVGAPVQPSTKSTTVVYLVGLEVHTFGAAAALLYYLGLARTHNFLNKVHHTTAIE